MRTAAGCCAFLPGLANREPHVWSEAASKCNAERTAPPSSARRTRPPPLEISGVRIVHHDLAHEVDRDAGWKKTVPVELPMRVIRRKQQEFVGTEMIDETADNVAGIRRIEWLQGQAEMITEDLRGGSVNPWDLRAQAAPELRHPP